eukprot:GHVU01114516.1.p1 GENE.GHVU01114516.1~~GHVU01114516.1.p1  ORF type:complete len:625 (+),score=63.98 GHVU01114516.1:56-1876(+)
MVKAFNKAVLTETGVAPVVAADVVRASDEDDDDLDIAYDCDGNILFDELDDVEFVDEEVMGEAVATVASLLDEANPTGLVAVLRSAGFLPLWGPCACHLMQLSVKDCLRAPLQTAQNKTADAVIQPIQDWVGCARRAQHVKECLKPHEITLQVANATRWGSKLRMMESVISASRVLHLHALPSVKSPPPSTSTVAVAEDLCSALQVAQGATEAMEGDRASISIVAPCIRTCRYDLRDIRESARVASPLRAEFANNLMRTIIERFEPLVTRADYQLAALTDPRWAKDQPEAAWRRLEEAVKLVQAAAPPPTPSPARGTQAGSSSSSSASSYRFVPFAGRRPTATTAVEGEAARAVKQYRALAALTADTADVDHWYSAHEKSLYHVHLLRKIYETVPASTAAVERVFSIAGRVGTKLRGRLLTENLSMLVQLKDRMLDNKLTSTAPVPAPAPLPAVSMPSSTAEPPQSIRATPQRSERRSIGTSSNDSASVRQPGGVAASSTQRALPRPTSETAVQPGRRVLGVDVVSGITGRFQQSTGSFSHPRPPTDISLSQPVSAVAAPEDVAAEVEARSQNTTAVSHQESHLFSRPSEGMGRRRSLRHRKQSHR